MTRDATLGDFATTVDDGATPVEPVHRWLSEATPCPGCGEPTQDRWFDGRPTGRCSRCREW